MASSPPSRDDIAERFLDQLPFQLYSYQEEALLGWFAAEQGLMVCAPTGTGKTLIAEAALFEALHNGTTAYYTTPLIALTEQKFREMQSLAEKWGFHPNDVGLVTGNRRENAEARILVVVAEVLFNRLLHGEAFDFSNVSAVVMDELHSFNDPERGVVWELTLGLLPAHVRTLLLSATVGNPEEFIQWAKIGHQRSLDLVEGSQRRVPLVFQWVPDRLLTEQIEAMSEGDEASRLTPALIFCFNREECWSVAEQLKGKGLLATGQQARLNEELKKHDWSQGAGPKLRQLLLRGVGVHHAGLLPKYRRIVEDLFQHKLLSVTVCTETLAAGINLPARSVVVPSLMKGPPGKKQILDPSAAHQMFGRAGRPQFDTQGYVFVLAHEDDVKIARWKEKFDRIPEDTKDPGLLRAKKDLKRKMPKRRETEQYWTEPQFNKLRDAKPGKLYSRGPLPWRLLAYMLDASPEVDRIRRLVAKRLMDSARLEAGQRELDRMLLTLWRAGYVTLEPKPPAADAAVRGSPDPSAVRGSPDPALPPTEGLLSGMLGGPDPGTKEEEQITTPRVPTAAANPSPVPGSAPKVQVTLSGVRTAADAGAKLSSGTAAADEPAPYRPVTAHPTPELSRLVMFRGVNPLYGMFLVNQLGIANREERIQAMESVLELPGSVGHFVRVPRHDRMPPGPLATTRLDEQLLRFGLATPEQISQTPSEDDDRRRSSFDEPRVWVLNLAEKLRLLFDYEFPGVHGVRTQAVWAAGEVLEFGGDFNKYVTSKSLQKQEGIVFRHLLRLILLIGEFLPFCPPETTEDLWRADLQDVADRLTECCRKVDPTSTQKMLDIAEADATEGLEPL